VEERLCPAHARLTIGSSGHATFVVPLEGVKRTLLFDHHELCLSESMEGRIATDGEVHDLRDLQRAHRRRGAWRIPLAETSRGKVTLGDVTILFQLVTPPTPPAPAALPAVARGGWIRNLDWVYTGIVLGVALFELGFTGYIHTLERPKKGPPSLADLPRTIKEFLVPKLKDESRAPVAATQEIAGASEKKRDADAKAKKAAKARGASREAQPGEVEALKQGGRERATAAEKVKSVGLVGLIGGHGPGGISREVADVFSEGGVARDVDETFRKAGELRVASAALERPREARGGGADGVEGPERLPDEPVPATPAGKLRQVKVERDDAREVPKTKVDLLPPESDTPEVDPEAIAQVVRRRIAAMKGCYERALRRNPDLQGKITVRFTIGPTGAVVDAAVESNEMGDPGAAECVVGRLRGFRFPKPAGGSVTVIYPFIFAAVR
jgi:hypothetical protein